MGYIVHHAIIVTSWEEKHLREAHDFLAKFGGVTPITSSAMNGYRSFMLVPDGSKEGWGHSSDGDSLRSDFKAWFRSRNGDLWIDWVEVEYGGDSGAARIVDHSDSDQEAQGE